MANESKKKRFVCKMCGKEYASEPHFEKHQEKCPKLDAGFLVQLKQSAYFKLIMSVISAYMDNVLIEIDGNKVIVRGVNTQGTAMVEFISPLGKFEVFNVGETDFTVFVNADDIRKIFSRVSREDRLQVNYVPSEAKIKLVLKRDTGRNRTFRLNTYDNEDQNNTKENFKKIRDADYKIIFNIFPEVLKQVFKDAEIYDNKIELYSPNEVDVEFRNNSVFGSFEAALGNKELFDLLVEEPGATVFFIEKARKTLDLASITKTLKIKTGDGFPFIMLFEFKNGMELLFAQAPLMDRETYEDDFDNEFDEDVKDAIEEVKALEEENEGFEDLDGEIEEDLDEFEDVKDLEEDE